MKYSLQHIAAVTAVIVLGGTCGAVSYAPTQAKAVSGDINVALAAANPGDELILDQGLLSAGELEITRSGTPDAPITLRGHGVGQTQINGVIKVRPGVSHWRFEGFSLDAGGGDEDGMRVQEGSTNLVFKNFTLSNGSGYGMRIEDNVSNILIEDCEIFNFVNPGTDAHGIGIQVADGVTVRRCNIHDNSGDGVQSHTNDNAGANSWATNITIENNRLERNGENAVDVKSTKGIVIRNNLMAGYRAAGGGEGIAVQIQYDAQNVTVIGNVIQDSVMGVEVTRGRKNGADYPRAPSGVSIIGNLIQDLYYDTFSNAGNGTGIVFRGASTVRVFNNSVLRAPQAGLYMGRGNNGEFVQDLQAKNNVFDGAKSDIDYNNEIDALGGITFDHNHFVHGTVRQKPISQWTSGLRDASASTGDPKIDANGVPQSGSPLIDSGANVGLPFAGAAPDRGWSEFANAANPIPTPAPSATPQPPPTVDPRLTERLYMPVARRGRR
jgi:hypothetical protein